MQARACPSFELATHVAGRLLGADHPTTVALWGAGRIVGLARGVALPS